MVGSDFQAPKSACTVVGVGFWIPMNTEPNRFAYKYKKLEISTVSAFYLQTTSAFAAAVPPRSDLQGCLGFIGPGTTTLTLICPGVK